MMNFDLRFALILGIECKKWRFRIIWVCIKALNLLRIDYLGLLERIFSRVPKFSQFLWQVFGDCEETVSLGQ
jgi:hypothetical protein